MDRYRSGNKDEDEGMRRMISDGLPLVLSKSAG